MEIIYKPHLKIRLKEREIPEDFPKQVIKSPDKEYFDVLAKRYIAIKKLSFKKELRNMVVAYDIIDKKIEIVTIHIISSKEINNKIYSGRWKKYEEKN